MSKGNRQTDFIDTRKFAADQNRYNILMIADNWHLDCLENFTYLQAEKYVKNPMLWDGVGSRLLIIMQWSNILSVLTSGGNKGGYFKAKDFIRVRAYLRKSGEFDNDRLSAADINAHLKWVEDKYKKHFVRFAGERVMRMGRLRGKQ